MIEVVNADLDLRRLRYFVAVADSLNFGRAAEQLMIAQPVLSRQIRVLEGELGATLFNRDTRGTELTPLGHQLRREAGSLLDAAAAVRRRIAVAARGATVLTVGFMPGLIVTEDVRAFQLQRPGVTVEVMRTGWDDQVQVLRDGRADVSYLRAPFDATGIATAPLFAEPRVVMIPTSHALAGRASVGLGDLRAEHLLQNPAAVPEWSGAAGEAGNRRPAVRPVSRTVEEKLELVAAGRGIAIFPLSTATFYRRADVTSVPIADLGPSEVMLGWEATRHEPALDEYVALTVAAHPVKAE
jgi:DNA-binding transcriptional LysR family regulator